MNRSIREMDAQRERWLTHRRPTTVLQPTGEDFALGGLGALVEDLDVRLLILPTDPNASIVSLDEESLDWLKTERPSPYGGQPIAWGQGSRTTSYALLLHDRYGSDQPWRHYLALHRHGGCEFGHGGCAHDYRGTRIFSLRHIVGLAFSALALQAEVIKRWQVQPPFELSVGLRNTQGAALGGFAEGWRQPGQDVFEFVTCLEDHVLLRWELPAEFDVEDVALEIGDRIEQSFGSTHRRHLAHRGDYEGQFDPRFRF